MSLFRSIICAFSTFAAFAVSAADETTWYLQNSVSERSPGMAGLCSGGFNLVIKGPQEQDDCDGFFDVLFYADLKSRKIYWSKTAARSVSTREHQESSTAVLRGQLRGGGKQTLEDMRAFYLSAPVATNISTPSFDCGKARSDSEKLICSDADLAKLDIELSNAYSRAKSKSIDASAFKKQTEAEWKWRESNCHDKECLLAWYMRRKKQLEGETLTKAQSDGGSNPDENQRLAVTKGGRENLFEGVSTRNGKLTVNDIASILDFRIVHDRLFSECTSLKNDATNVRYKVCEVSEDICPYSTTGKCTLDATFVGSVIKGIHFTYPTEEFQQGRLKKILDTQLGAADVEYKGPSDLPIQSWKSRWKVNNIDIEIFRLKGVNVYGKPYDNSSVFFENVSIPHHAENPIRH